VIYLDNAATSFHKAPGVAEAVYQSFSTIGNAGRGAHRPTLNASRLLYDTREKLAQLLGAEGAAQIAFASNVTQALNTAIQGLIHPGDHVVTTVCEHNSVLRPLYRKEQEGAELTIVPATPLGTVDYEALENSIRPNTRAVVMHHGSNLTGNVADISRVSQMIHKVGGLLIVDAAQTAGAIPIDVQNMGVDVLCFTGHKSLLAPQGTGGLYVRTGLELPPLLVGGSGIHSFDHQHPSAMPEALEAGTVNGHGLAGLNKALDFLLATGVDTIHQRETQLAQALFQGIEGAPNVRFYGDKKAEPRVPIITLNIGDMDAAEVSDLLWEEYEICVRGGAHCAPLMHQHFGTVEQGAVRFSLSYFTTMEEVERASRAIWEIAAYGGE
jgi:cysteine desulfurase family protein